MKSLEERIEDTWFYHYLFNNFKFNHNLPDSYMAYLFENDCD
jgi:hypothetical protein